MKCRRMFREYDRRDWAKLSCGATLHPLQASRALYVPVRHRRRARAQLSHANTLDASADCDQTRFVSIILDRVEAASFSLVCAPFSR